MVSLIFSLLSAIVSLVLVMQFRTTQTRGTNTFTRFVRDSWGNGMFTRILLLNTALGVVFTITSFAGENQWYAGLPNFAIVALCFFFKFKSNKNEQRVKDARGVTKASLQVGAATAQVAGTAIGTAVGAPQIGYAVGSVAGNVAGAAANAMTDVQSNINVAEIRSMLSDEEFIKIAGSLGIPTQGMSLEQVAGEVYKSIPSSYIESHSADSAAKVAVKFLSGAR